MTNDIQTSTDEIWKSISDHEGFYEVSNHGRVRSLDRLVYHPYANHARVRGRVLKPNTTTPLGHVSVSLSVNGLVTQRSIHRLVLAAFVRPPKDGEVCLHRDNEPTNNHVGNLKWGSQMENIHQCINEGRSSKGETHTNAKLTAKQVLEIRALQAGRKETQQQLAERFGVHIETIGRIVRRKYWRHI